MRVAVIGAGIIGTSIALELRKRGAEVTLVDRDEPGRGCSFGNSGAISLAGGAAGDARRARLGAEDARRLAEPAVPAVDVPAARRVVVVAVRGVRASIDRRGVGREAGGAAWVPSRRIGR